ncbi:Large subunit GTPase 1 -like protein [Echinococcus granulosus]|nr:Large subunit GTPase 1 -like protein [Echinococcus granulosus]
MRLFENHRLANQRVKLEATMPKKKYLGRALVRQNKRKDRRPFNYANPEDSPDWCHLPVKSITQETTLDDFLHTADLSNRDFAAQKVNVRVLSKAEIVGIITPEERARRKVLMQQNKSALTVLKRPKINRNMTKEEIANAEQGAYLSWRRDLARLEQLDGIVITPYERNLEFWRQLWQVVERSDVLVQVVDARQPLLFFSTSLNDYIREVDSHKGTVVLINKSDFLTRNQRDAWAKYFDSVGVRVLFFSALNSQSQLSVQSIREGHGPSSIPEETKEELEAEILQDSLSVDEMCKDFDESSLTSSETSTMHGESEEEGGGEASSESYSSAADVLKEKIEVVNGCDVLSVHELIDELTHLGTRHGDFPYLTVGFLGYPNVGKSSTLNALCGAKKTPVSATPGKTKHFQTIFLQPDLQLCDCPGMVMPSFVYTQEDLVVAGILPIDEMRDCIPPIRVICEQIPREVLTALYGISIRPPKEFEDPNRPPTPHELLAAYACIRGFMSAKGNPHYDRAARIILKDYVKGRLRYCHPPPGIDAADYQVMGATERLEEEEKEWKEIGESVEGEEAKMLLRLSVYLAPTELHKLWFRLQHQRHRRAGAERRGMTAVGEEEANILTEFDRIALTSQQSVVGAHPLIRSKKKLASMPRALNADDDDDDDTVSTASWSTVASSTTVGGASLLSGVTTSSAVGKKPWRQLSAVKKIGEVEMGKVGAMGVGRNRKKKEKLRRVYANLDRHEVE